MDGKKVSLANGLGDDEQVVRKLVETSLGHEAPEGEEDEFEQTLHMRLEGAGHEALDCKCEAVAADSGSVMYQCSYQLGGRRQSEDVVAADGRVTRKHRAAGTIQGKFAMNLP